MSIASPTVWASPWNRTGPTSRLRRTAGGHCPRRCDCRPRGGGHLGRWISPAGPWVQERKRSMNSTPARWADGSVPADGRGIESRPKAADGIPAGLAGGAGVGERSGRSSSEHSTGQSRQRTTAMAWLAWSGRRAFCSGGRIETKAGGRRSFWGREWLPDVRTRRAKDKPVPGQLGLWERCQVQNAFSLPNEVLEVADRFFRAGYAWP